MSVLLANLELQCVDLGSVDSGRVWPWLRFHEGVVRLTRHGNGWRVTREGHIRVAKLAMSAGAVELVGAAVKSSAAPATWTRVLGWNFNLAH